MNIGRQDGFVPVQIHSATVIIHSVISKVERACSRDSHAMTPPPPCFTDEAVCLGSFAVPFFLHIFAFPSLRWRFIFVSSVHKHSSKNLLSHICAFFCKLESCLSIFGADQRFASCCVASVILCQSLPRTVDCQSITPAFWNLLVILQTRLLGFIFTAFFICLSSTTVVFSADQVVGVAGVFQTQTTLIVILVCVCHHRMQDSEFRSNGYNWYDTSTAFNIWRMNETGHSWSLRKATFPILMLTSDGFFVLNYIYIYIYNIYFLSDSVLNY